MNKKVSLSVAFIGFLVSTTIAQTDSAMIKKIFNEALTNGKSYSNLDYMCNKIGPRLSGSVQAQQAVEWAFKAMKEAGADTVFLQECMVPHWVRGAKEIAKVITTNAKNSKEIPVCALGGSIATPPQGITANVIEVKSIEELKSLGKEKIQGKIVFFNGPMDPTLIETGGAYGKAVRQRGLGAIEAARYGAIASVVRSVTLVQNDYPHTGAMRYNDSITKIPHAAISTNAANWLSEYLKTDKDLKIFLKMSCQTLPDEKSYNVVGEIRGSAKTNEYVVVGGHLDSWDLATGANDDGTGVVQSIEVLRLFKALGIKPKYNLRAVAFMNEENGVRGGKKYAELAKLNKEKHIAALESDGGGASPRGFGSDGIPSQLEKIKSWQALFLPYGLYNFRKGGGGTDIEPLQEDDKNIPMIGLITDSQRYFDYHHCAIDVFENVNKRELELGGASMAALIWLIDKYGL
ncbi:MAG: M20/M25/M40 family metallo-hydrolase [Bacteroidetes bacterium]|nr:M20/M25/M40 family metallo-hydrolase [Bacteroidota bacterium]